MNEFKGYHPLVNFIYFLFVITLSAYFMHPVFVVINFISSVLYVYPYKKSKMFFVIPLVVILSVIYPLHNHQGITILAYFPDGNPLTVESVLYGFIRAIAILNIICWSVSFFRVITTDKLLYLLSTLSPSLALVFSMILRFVPRFLEQLKKVEVAQRGMGRDIHSGSIAKRVKLVMSVFSIMITWSVENSIEIADSMKARGYGTGRRTWFSIYTFCKRDLTLLSVILVLGLSILLIPKPYYSYYPSLHFSVSNPYFFAVCFLLCMVPEIIKIYDHRKLSGV